MMTDIGRQNIINMSKSLGVDLMSIPDDMREDCIQCVYDAFEFYSGRGHDFGLSISYALERFYRLLVLAGATIEPEESIKKRWNDEWKRISGNA